MGRRNKHLKVNEIPPPHQPRARGGASLVYVPPRAKIEYPSVTMSTKARCRGHRVKDNK